MSFYKPFLAAAVAGAAMIAMPALAQSYSGGTGTFNGLGNEEDIYPGNIYDQIVINPLTGTYTGFGTYDLQTVTFNAGVNRVNVPFDFGGVFSLTGTFGGNPFNFDINYTGTIDSFDTITLGGNTIDVFGTPVYINKLTLIGTGPNPSMTGTLTVRVGPAVPEPATWMMMIAGFGMIGAGVRRRGNVKTSVTYA